MPIWESTPVEQAPAVKLISWRIFEVASELWPERTRHFVGYNGTEREGRVSSRIDHFDPASRTGITSSGRIYELEGDPGSGSADGMHTWSLWCKRNEITDSVDITCEAIGA
jgi:hypothetical protein